jgi:CRISPR-associated protein Cas1
VEGVGAGNVLVRREQYRRADSDEASQAIAAEIVAAKIANSRTVLMKSLRDDSARPGHAQVADAAAELKQRLQNVRTCDSLETVRGLEGDAARIYFRVFDHLITAQKSDFRFTGRSRRPPMDAINSLMSFIYTLLQHDVRSALAAAGLDPFVGYLHRDRPGRPGLALDLMEEFRAYLADRMAVSLVNLRQVGADGFRCTESGAVVMDDDTRKAVLVAYQRRKQEEITHPFLGEKTILGMVFHLQARLLSRYLRNELDAYPAFVWRG